MSDMLSPLKLGIYTILGHDGITKSRKHISLYACKLKGATEHLSIISVANPSTIVGSAGLVQNILLTPAAAAAAAPNIQLLPPSAFPSALAVALTPPPQTTVSVPPSGQPPPSTKPVKKSNSTKKYMELTPFVAKQLLELAIVRKEQCPVTAEEYIIGETAAMPCGHLFMRIAIEESFKKEDHKCPWCRQIGNPTYV